VVKKLGEKAAAKDWGKSINSKTKQCQTSIDIIKQTLYFLGFILCQLHVDVMMARCTIEPMIHGYHKYVSIWANSVIKQDLSNASKLLFIIFM